MSDDAPRVLHVAALPRHAPQPFALRPAAAELSAMAARLDLLGLRKLSFEGRLHAEGRRDWRLEGKLGATVVQPCSVTLAPVTTRLDEHVVRRLVSELPEARMEGDEIEMPEDESLEQLGTEIDLAAIMEEALALALPLYPRASDAELDETVFTEPGREAMTDEDAKPLAGLAALMGMKSAPPQDDEDGGVGEDDDTPKA